MGNRAVDSDLMVLRPTKHPRVLQATSLYCQAQHDLCATPLAFPEQGLVTDPSGSAPQASPVISEQPRS